MASIYIPDETLTAYAVKEGGTKAGKEAIKQLVEENKPNNE